MSSLLPLVLFVIVSKSACEGTGGFGYELLIEKMEHLDEKLEKFQNTTVHLEVRRHLEAFEQNSKIIQIMDKIYQHMSRPSSCDGLERSGRHNLTVSNKIYEVYCEQDQYDGGWIVIQNRFNGSVDFYRNWTEYRNGFGSLDGEFWLGLQTIYWLTSSRNYELLVHLEDFEGVVKYAKYQKFEIASENEQYMVKTLGSYTGTVGDSFYDSRGDKFSTYDQDNDKSSSLNCAEHSHGAWWYDECSYSNLNGAYHNGVSYKRMYWASLGKRLKTSRMMIREV